MVVRREINVLCFGDSNTYGYIAGSAERFDRQKRWPGVVADALAPRIHIIEEGLNGRTACTPEPGRPYRSGLEALPLLMESHAPLDYLLIMLGTNDVLLCDGIDAYRAASDVGTLLDGARRYGCRLGIAPVHLAVIAPPLALPDCGELDAVEDRRALKTHGFSSAYKELAGRYDVGFIDARSCEVSPIDGVHLTQTGHRQLADKVIEFLA